jgi:hypothetical protein
LLLAIDMAQSPQDLLEQYVDRMIGKTIVGAGTTEDDSFEIDLSDGSVIVFWGDELSMLIDSSELLN